MSRRPVPRPEGYALDHARSVFAQVISRSGQYAEEERLRQSALRFQIAGVRGQNNSVKGYQEDELARQAMLRFNVAGFREDEALRRGARSMIAGDVGKQDFWLAVVDHLNQALPYVTNIVNNVIGSREKIDTLKLQIKQMEAAGQQEYIVQESRNYWLAQIAQQNGYSIDPNTYQQAMVFGDALKAMGSQGQGYLQQGYNQAVSLGVNYGQGGAIESGYARLNQSAYGSTWVGKNMGWVVLGVVGGVVVLGAMIAGTVVLVTRRQ
ncbi:MAG: hypothetical protein PHC52_00630 [Syntrophales bacterium]|nr:hypothetical protein [Syntrophales bacterium]